MLYRKGKGKGGVLCRVELGSSGDERSLATREIGESIPTPGREYLGHLSSIHTHPCSPNSINWYL